MKRCAVGVVILVGVGTLVTLSCMDREPKPVCPVPTEVSRAESAVPGFKGVDLLVVVDNSGSMVQEQQILATGFFTLINSLANPTTNWPYDAVENIRVAVTTTDMGLQYDDGETAGVPNTPGCTDDDGDNGAFQSISASTANITSGAIACDKGDDQCPLDFNCVDSVCEASTSPYAVNCNPPIGGNWAETSAVSPNAYLATQVACLGVQGTDGCGIEQQLKAAPQALKGGQQGFLKNDHLLAVLIVSDEEDCSIQYDGLFDTPEWKSTGTVGPEPGSGHLNTACNYPYENETKYLFPPQTFYDDLVTAKGGRTGAVIFAAIVGVPPGEKCEGKGTEIGDCLNESKMQLSEQLFTSSTGSTEFYHFAPACERMEGKNIVTTARPGRRYVQVAEKFAGNSYIYSICNEDWSPAMASIAEVIAQAIKPQCYPKALEWQLATAAEAPDGCENCGAAKCEMIAYINETEEVTACPSGLTEIGRERLDSGEMQFACRVDKILTPRFCDEAASYVDEKAVGWWYCENLNLENFEEACSDNIDNDGENGVDCKDSSCVDCRACGGKGAGTCEDKCTYSVETTEQTKSVTRGYSVTIQCLQQFTFEDENCQENTRESCVDNEDNDGNGVWDCEAGDTNFPDPNCCPLKVNPDNTCTPVGFTEICGNIAVKDDDPNNDTVCEAHARLLNCTLEK